MLTLMVAAPVLLLALWGIGEGYGGGFFIFLIFGILLGVIGVAKFFVKKK